jgi:AcrR family transcriptional regulator
MADGALEPDRFARLCDALRAREWGELTTEELTRALGLSRMTLHRRGIDKEAVLAQLGEHVEGEYREAVLAAVVSSGTPRERLRAALEGLCEVNERNLGLLDALSLSRNFVLHEAGDGPVMTRAGVTDGLRRILEDGIADGTLAAEDPQAAATLLFNATGWTYRHMRSGHRWEPERTRRLVVDLMMEGASR